MIRKGRRFLYTLAHSQLEDGLPLYDERATGYADRVWLRDVADQDDNQGTGPISR